MGADRGAAHRKLIALTRDATLAKALQELADETSIHVVADLRQFTDELLQHAGSIALLDAAALDAPLEAAVDAITTQFPELRLMVAGQAPEQNLLATRIASETVFRFVHKPASPQRVKLFLEAAARSGERRRVAAASAPSIDLATGSSVPPGGAGSRGLLIAAAAVVVLAAGAAWVFWPWHRQPPYPRPIPRSWPRWTTSWHVPPPRSRPASSWLPTAAVLPSCTATR
jgi:hypothetical protein